MDIQSGSGGIDAQDWANMLLRMYLFWLNLHNFKVYIVNKLKGDVVGIKSVTIEIIGNYAYGWLRTETGIHRLVRKSPFNSINKRHTSFSSVFVYPKIYNNINIEINYNDLRIDFYRSSGSGGQHLNKTESAVRITHIPTKIVVKCQDNRSQYINKNQALKQLKIKLYKLELKKKKSKNLLLEMNKLNITWSNHIRSYILDDCRVKDLRTGLESRNIHSILNGNLDKFIEASLKAGL